MNLKKKKIKQPFINNRFLNFLVNEQIKLMINNKNRIKW